MISHIFIFLTPFHKEACKSIFGDILDNEKTLILFHPRLSVEEFNSNTVSIHSFETTKTEFFKKGIFWLKNQINKLNIKADEALIPFTVAEDVKLITGTDRELICQIMIHKISKLKNKAQFIFVDEGIGYYSKPGVIDWVLKKIFPRVTLFLLNFPIYHIRPLGSHPLGNTIYLRNIDLLKHKRKDVHYKPYKIKREVLNIATVTKSILFYSFPDQDYNLPKDFKTEFYSKILNILERTGHTLIIKPHPREDVSQLQEDLKDWVNLTFLEKNILGENLPYDKFDFILNLHSSIVYDLIDRKYPSDQIVTFGFKNPKKVSIPFNRNYIEIENFDPTTLEELLLTNNRNSKK